MLSLSPVPVVTELVCPVGNTTYSHGDKVSLDTCTTCHCSEGLFKCYKEECSSPICSWSSKPSNQCCPTCHGCLSSKTGKKYYIGEKWTEDRSCTECECVEGQVRCTTTLCAPCSNPSKPIPGQCCPICNDSEEGRYSLFYYKVEPMNLLLAFVPSHNMLYFAADCLELKRNTFLFLKFDASEMTS